MLTNIEINGFKTFYRFSTSFAPFVVIAGTNGSGKSNLFDALRLLARLTETDLKTAFNEQRGEAAELFTRFPNGEIAEEMSFVVDMLVDKKIKDSWGGEEALKYTRLRYELNVKREKDYRGLEQLFVTHEALTAIRPKEDEWVKKNIPSDFQDYWRPKVKVGKRGIPYISTEIENDQTRIQTHQDGKRGGSPIPAKEIEQTVLSGINSVDFPHAFAAKMEMKSWKFFQLNPEKLRLPSPRRFSKDTIAYDGSNLAAALYRIKASEGSLSEVSRALNNLLPSFTEVDVEEDLAHDHYIIKTKETEDGRTFSSQVLSEGTLRLLALCALEFDDKHQGLLCFEEPENGLHPFRLKFAVKLLRDLATDFTDPAAEEIPLRQIITNTHSPVFLGEIFSHCDSFLALFASLVTVILPKKMKLKITRMQPIEKSIALRLFEDLQTPEKALAYQDALHYLKSADFEDLTQKLVA